jgi:hypothetical protein
VRAYHRALEVRETEYELKIEVVTVTWEADKGQVLRPKWVEDVAIHGTLVPLGLLFLELTSKSTYIPYDYLSRESRCTN